MRCVPLLRLKTASTIRLSRLSPRVTSMAADLSGCSVDYCWRRGWRIEGGLAQRPTGFAAGSMPEAVFRLRRLDQAKLDNTVRAAGLLSSWAKELKRSHFRAEQMIPGRKWLRLS